jgi:hypothetical protein
MFAICTIGGELALETFAGFINPLGFRGGK